MAAEDYDPQAALRRALEARDFEGAIAHLDDALACDPQDLALRIRRGALLRQAGRLDDSIVWLEGVLSTAPGDLKAMRELAVALCQADRTEDADAVASAILGADPKHRAALATRVEIARRGLGPSAALDRLDAALEVYPDDMALRGRRGALLRQTGRLKECAAWLESFLAASPGNLTAMQELALALRQDGRIGESARVIEEMLAIAPTHRGALTGRIDLAAQQLLHDAALDCLDAALEVYPDDLALRIRRGALLRLLGRMVEARQWLQKVARSAPENPSLKRELITTDLQLGAVDRALEAAAELARAEPENVAAQGLWVKALRASGANAEARRLADSLLARSPDSPEFAALRISSLVAEGDLAAAHAALDASPEAARDGEALMQSRARMCSAAGDYAAADAIYQDMPASGPLKLATIIGRLHVALASGIDDPGFRNALADVRRLAVQHAAKSGHGNAERYLLHIALCVGDWPEALRLVTDLRERQPRDAMLVFYEAKAAWETGDAERGRRNLEAFLAQHPAYRPAAMLRDSIDLATGDVDAYLDRQRRMLALRNANLIGSHLSFAQDLYMLDRPDEAAECLEACREFANGRTAAALGLTFLIGGEEEAANDMFASRGDRAERRFGTLPDEDLRRLFDRTRSIEVAGPDSYAAARLAWHVCEEKPESFAEWRRRAGHATYASRKLSRFPYAGAALDGLIEPVDWGPIQRLMAEGAPFLMVSTHSGPRVLGLIDRHIPDVLYLLQPTSYTSAPGDVRGQMLASAGADNDAAIAVYKALRQGRRVYSTPDVPAGLMRRGKPGGAARGRIFGAPCAIVDTVPKLSQGLRVPSFWIQPMWRGDRIVIEIAALPTAEPGEPSQEWRDRWAQAYLDKVEAVMRSAPENQNLTAGLWRYLLLMGMGKRAEEAAHAR